jgi:hypothetical protein
MYLFMIIIYFFENERKSKMENNIEICVFMQIFASSMTKKSSFI